MSKPKKINVELIGLGHEAYKLLEDVRSAHHPDTGEAQIALAWRIGQKADVDGRLVLGRCMKASDLQRELVDYDFVIVLNKEVWEDELFGSERKRALLDHEMCHAARTKDSGGDWKEDERERPVWRVRKHDIEEFREIVERHGLYKADLEAFAKTILDKQGSLIPA